jgi:transcriptional regulator with XRE-family HTH domain
LEVSLRKFAKAAGVHPTYLSKIELGHLPPPSVEVQRRFDDAFLAFGGHLLESKRRELAALEDSVFLLEVQVIERIVARHVKDGGRTERLMSVLMGCIAKLEKREA